MISSPSISSLFVFVVMLLVFAFDGAARVSANNISVAAYFPNDTTCAQTPAVPTTSVINGGCNLYSGNYYGVSCNGNTASLTVYQHGTGGCIGASLTGTGVGDGQACILVTPTFTYFYAKVNCSGSPTLNATSSSSSSALPLPSPSSLSSASSATISSGAAVTGNSSSAGNTAASIAHSLPLMVALLIVSFAALMLIVL